MAQLLANDLGLHCVFFPTADSSFYQRRLGLIDISIGNAILSRWPIMWSEVEADGRRSGGRRPIDRLR
jgi:hypothetical protein